MRTGFITHANPGIYQGSQSVYFHAKYGVHVSQKLRRGASPLGLGLGVGTNRMIYDSAAYYKPSYATSHRHSGILGHPTSPLLTGLFYYEAYCALKVS